MGVLAKRPKIAMVPYPAKGHITPMLQLGSVLDSLGFEPVLIVGQSTYSEISPKGGDHANKVTIMSIPDELEEKNQAANFASISHATETVMPAHLEFLLRKLMGSEGGLTCIIVDLLAFWAIEVGGICHVPVAGFWPAMSAMYNIMKAIPDLVTRGLISSQDGAPLGQGKLNIQPCLTSLDATNLPWLVGAPTSWRLRFVFWLKVLEKSNKLKWILINSFTPENQHHKGSIASIQKCMHDSRSSLFHVGPLTRHAKASSTMWNEDEECLSWLAHQSPGSVIYVSFGSWVTLSIECHIIEMAMALEASNRPFLWALGTQWQASLPVGFVDRVGVRGRVVEWAPQKKVLASVAVGCFLTHCGWNSLTEAILARKPLLCWPIAGDQFVISEFIVGVWEVGIKMEGTRRDEIERDIETIMDKPKLNEIQKKMEDLRERVFGVAGEFMALKNLTMFMSAMMNEKCIAKDIEELITA